MSIIAPTRRGFLLGVSALLAAPAIVRAQSIMPVKTIPIELPPQAIIKPVSRWKLLELTRDHELHAWVDGEQILPKDMHVGDYGGRVMIRLPDQSVISVPVPPQGSYQKTMVRSRNKLEDNIYVLPSDPDSYRRPSGFRVRP